jgi:hypothetical protein
MTVSQITIGEPISMDEVLLLMTGWTPYEITRCGYLPEVGECADNPGGGCQNTASVALGSRDEYKLCEECAALPRFKRFRHRRQLAEGEI